MICFFPYGAYAVTALYASFCLIIFGIYLPECLSKNNTVECQTDEVGNLVLIWSTHFFNASVMGCLSLHLLVVQYCRSGGDSSSKGTKGTLLGGAALACMSLAFTANGVSYIFFENSEGSDDLNNNSNNNKGYYVSTIVSYILMGISSIIFFGLSRIALNKMVGVKYRCCKIESICFVVLNIAATIYIIHICVSELTSQSEDTLDTGAMSEDPYRLLRFGQGLWNLSYILFIISVATVWGSFAKQDIVFVMGLPNSVAAAGMIILQLTEAALRILLLVFSKVTYDEKPQENAAKKIAPIIFGYCTLMTAFFAHNLIISLLAEEHDGELGSKDGHDQDFTDESYQVDSDSSHGEGLAIGSNGDIVGMSKSICYGDANSNRHLTDDDEEAIEPLEAKSSDLLSSYIDCGQENDDIERGDNVPQKESQKVGDQSSSEQQIDDVVKWVSNCLPATQVFQREKPIGGNALCNEFPPTSNTFSDSFSRMASAATTSAVAAYTTASAFTKNSTDDELNNCDETNKETCIKPNIESSSEHLEENCGQVNDDIERGDIGDQPSSEQQIDDVVSGNALSNEFPPTSNTFSDSFSRMASAATSSAVAAYTTASAFTQNSTDDELNNCDETDNETCIKPNIESSSEHLEEKVADESPVDLLEEIEVPLIEHSLSLKSGAGVNNNIIIEPNNENSVDLLEKRDVISADLMPNNQNKKRRKRLASTISRTTLRPKRKKKPRRYRKKYIKLKKLVIPSAIKESEERSSTTSSRFEESEIKEDVGNESENNESLGQTKNTNILVNSGLEDVTDDKNGTEVNMKEIEPIVVNMVLNVNETIGQTKDDDISFDQTTTMAQSTASEVKNSKDCLPENAHSKLTSIPDKITPISNAESNPECVNNSRSMEQKETILSDGQRQNNAVQNLAYKEEDPMYTSFSNSGLARLNCFDQSYLTKTSTSDEDYLSCFPALQKPRQQQHPLQPKQRPDKSVRNLPSQRSPQLRSWNEPLPIPILFCEEDPSFKIDVVSALTGDFDDDQSTFASPNHDEGTLQPSGHSNKVKEDTETDSHRNAQSENDTQRNNVKKEDTDTDSHRADDSGIVVDNSEGAMTGDKIVNSDGEKKNIDNEHDDDTTTEDKKGNTDDDDIDDEKKNDNNGNETRQADRSSSTISKEKNDPKADDGDHHGDHSALPCSSSSAAVSISRHGRW